MNTRYGGTKAEWLLKQACLSKLARFTVLEVLHDIALKAGNIGKTKEIISLS
jgi:hypothetical protein